MSGEEVEDGVSPRWDQCPTGLGVEGATLVLCDRGVAEGTGEIAPVMSAGEEIAAQRGKIGSALVNHLLDGQPTSGSTLGLLQLGAQLSTEPQHDPTDVRTVPSQRRRARQLTPGVGSRSAPYLDGDEEFGVERQIRLDVVDFHQARGRDSPHGGNDEGRRQCRAVPKIGALDPSGDVGNGSRRQYGHGRDPRAWGGDTHRSGPVTLCPIPWG